MGKSTNYIAIFNKKLFDITRGSMIFWLPWAWFNSRWKEPRQSPVRGHDIIWWIVEMQKAPMMSNGQNYEWYQVKVVQQRHDKDYVKLKYHTIEHIEHGQCIVWQLIYLLNMFIFFDIYGIVDQRVCVSKLTQQTWGTLIAWAAPNGMKCCSFNSFFRTGAAMFRGRKSPEQCSKRWLVDD